MRRMQRITTEEKKGRIEGKKERYPNDSIKIRHIQKSTWSYFVQPNAKEGRKRIGK